MYLIGKRPKKYEMFFMAIQDQSNKKIYFDFIWLDIRWQYTLKTKLIKIIFFTKLILMFTEKQIGFNNTVQLMGECT